ncbi:putative chromatin-remodeling complex ATPase chain [Dendrobium catenatum]|uniref:Putative chromatin-remodeling complex ATPase chain n=1 Tax=Dendrobium catenatum TaxID=906689 RepID=A0A2I0VRK9_9ASPA|nr:putative chromatin-remodeling complex ATPase chain [Dendrobium catenatum]
MDYRRLLIAATEIVLSSDHRADGSAPLNSAELGVSGVLKPHQIEGVSWLIRRYELGVNGLLGDEMGLGKTVQAIAFLNYLKMQNISPGPFLVLCPLSITDGWFSEFNKFCQNLKVLQYVGDKEHRRALRRIMHEHLQKQSALCNVGEAALNFDVLLTTYEMALLDQDFLSQIPWHYAVIDEAQRLKNPSSVGQNLEKAKEQFKILKHVLKAFMLRRTKAMLIERGTLTLPPLTEITVLVPFVSLQRKVYMSILRRELPALLSLSSGAYTHQSLQNIVMQLRKVCSHPYLFNGIEPEPYVEGEHLVQASGKLIALDLLLKKLHADGHRVLIFAQMTHTLDILQDFLELRKYTYERLDGSVRAEERFVAIRNFSLNLTGDVIEPQAKLNGAFVFIISTRAGGVGLNLVAADTVIFYEQDWNPQVDKQALQRSHRIGQINHVLSINLVTQNTIEEVIMRRAVKKLQLSNSVMGTEVECNKAGNDALIEAGDMRSLIRGLQVFDPVDNNANNLNVDNLVELSTMTEKVVQMRNSELLNKDDCIFEINPSDVLKKASSFNFDVGLDEVSYLSWIEKLKKVAPATQETNEEFRKRKHLSEERLVKQEADRRKAEEKKVAKWEALGYHSLSVYEPDVTVENDLISDSGSVQFVYGDCTKPSSVCPTEPAIIFSCVDNSGNWGHGGMFTALANLSASIPDAYHRASEFGDLHMGDLHLMKLNDGDNGIMAQAPLWVALAVVQSYSSRRKVPRSNISTDDLEKCLSKASASASQNSASIHMPRIGYQDGSQRSEWYTIERLLRKYASIFGISIFVYYYRRTQQ